MQHIPQEQTGLYSNAQRLRLLSRLTTFGKDDVTYNRDMRAVKEINGHRVSRFVYAYGAACGGNSIAEVMKWRVDVGGGKVDGFDHAVRHAIYQVIKVNADVYFSGRVQDETVKDLARMLPGKIGHMSLYGFIDAIESLMAHEEPCAIEMYGFDVKSILKACNQYWAKAKREYEAFEQTTRQGEYLEGTYERGVPMPDEVKAAIEQLEQKHGVVQDTDDGRAAMRAAAKRWKEEGGELKF